MFTARYGLIPYIKQITFSFEKVNVHLSGFCFVTRNVIYVRHPVLADHEIGILAPVSSVFFATAEISASHSGISENPLCGMLPNIPHDSTFIHNLLPFHPLAIRRTTEDCYSMP